MKKIIFVLLSAVILCSCSKELDTEPNDRYTEDTYWTTEKNATAALSGCYNLLMKAEGIVGPSSPMYEDSASPNQYAQTNALGLNSIATGTQNASTAGLIFTRWTDNYKMIGRCNTLLAHIDEVTSMAASLKEREKAEAKFLRAYSYSLLEMYYGGVPLITDAPDLDTQATLPRNTREEVVTQILKDLNEAAAVLPLKYTGADIGRATKGAALALKAKVLLFDASPLVNTNNDLSKWSTAAAAAKAVMDLTGAGYALFPNYRSLFLPVNENSSECIFDVQFSVAVAGFGSSFDQLNASFNTNAPVRGLIDAYDMKDGLPPSQSPLYNPAKPYENRDPRMYQTIVYPGDTFVGLLTTPTNPFKITGYGIKKYTVNDTGPTPGIINTAGKSEINYMILRYADVLLMYAEAQNEAVGPDGSVYSAINAIRQRAGLNPYQIPAGKTQAQMRDLIRHERRIELATEGFYYTDIRRWKIAETVLNGQIFNSQNQAILTRTFNPARDYWWPIPQPQIDLNPNLKQNPGY